MDKDYVLILMQDVIKSINENPLPISVKYFVLKDIFSQTEDAYNNYVQKQMIKVDVSEPEEKTIEMEIPIENISKEVSKEEE